MEHRFEELQARYRLAKQDIENETRFSVEGRRDALQELQRNHLVGLRQLVGDLGASANGLQKEIATLRKTAPAQVEMTEQELLAERREVELLLGRLATAGREGFIQAAEEAATRQPSVFLIGYRQAMEIAEGYFPDPGPDEPGTSGAMDRGRRGFAFSSLQGFFDRAMDATVTPAELERQAKIASLERSWAKNFALTIRVKRAAEAVEQALAPGFDDVAAEGIRR